LGWCALLSAYVFSFPFSRKVALILLLVVSWGFSDAWAQSPVASGSILPRTAGDFQRLLELDHTPAASLAVPAKSATKIKTKYDITKIGERGVEKGINFYSIQAEQALGRELAQEIEANCKLLEDPVVNEYVNRLGQRLVSHSDAKVPFTIKVLDSEEVNAFALPGGYFYVNTGLILAAETEAELAGVMAHEIAHVAARHGTRGATRSQIWNLASMSLVFVGGPVGMALREVSNIAMPMTFMKFSRGFEREADLLGIEYEYAAGYDPESFIDFFERIAVQRKKPNFLARAFASHPMNEDRIRRAQKEIATMLPEHDEYVVNTSEFDQVKARLIQLINDKTKLGIVDPSGGNKPTLHRRDREQTPPDNSDDRPTLQRR
jgi:beta-barrel assembly-enhancing protease